jgi:hypothetical protein
VLNGAVGIGRYAPKAGALPGCATPRQETLSDYKRLPTWKLLEEEQIPVVKRGDNKRSKHVARMLAVRFVESNTNLLRADQDLGISARFHQPPPRAWNRAAVSA